jgi:hypothetical protein
VRLNGEDQASNYLVSNIQAGSDGVIGETMALPITISTKGIARIEAYGDGYNGAQRILSAMIGVWPSSSSDGDSDGIPDLCDLCPQTTSSDQTDSDNDGFGDVCDAYPLDINNDLDGDGMGSDVDVCPFDPLNDADSDDICASSDNCPQIHNVDQRDSDLDGAGDECDVCPFDPEDNVDGDGKCTGILNVELKNLSTRADVGTGADIAIAGFIIKGSEEKCVVVRGRGPSMNVSGVPLLTDPNLTLYSGQTIIDSNEDWMNQADPANQIIIENLGLAPTDFREAAIHKCLPEGPFTALLRGGNGGTGVGIVEVFDADDGSSILENISTRARVGTGPLVTIAGFIIEGDSPKKILVRGRGPTVGVPDGVIRLSNPNLRLYQLLEDNSNVLLEENDNWGLAANASEISASGQAPGDPNEAAILMMLDPGVYTGILDGVFGATGSGIIEVIDLTDN